MSYYNTSYSGSDYGESNFNSYPVNFNYDYAQVPSFMTYNSYEYNQPNYEYDSNLYFSPNYYPDHSYNQTIPYNDHSYNQTIPYNDHSYNQTISYSATTYSNSKSIVYDPSYDMTKLVLSYSTLEFNEPAFDEYDPTPYGGGYDIDKTYGKPLPPSDKICYPRFGSNSIPTIVPVEESKIDEKIIIPQNETIDQTSIEKPLPHLQDSTINETFEPSKDNNSTINEDSDDSEENDDDDDEEDDSGSSYVGEISNGKELVEYEKEVVSEYPSGYGLEAVDICESLFGWPCLTKMKRENCCGVVHRGNQYCQDNMWKGTADYLFGNPNPYGRRSDDDGGQFFYGYSYERH